MQLSRAMFLHDEDFTNSSLLFRTRLGRLVDGVSFCIQLTMRIVWLSPRVAGPRQELARIADERG
jgi:hypothetical protein